MDDRELDELVLTARGLVDQIVRLAGELLSAGHALERVHARYVEAAFELVREMEARALLASAGDADALRSVRRLVDELDRLRTEANAELAGDA